MKIYIKNIDCCRICPNIGIDQNVTRWECKAKGSMFLEWMNGVDDYYIEIPSWCPLPDDELIIADELITADEMKIS